MDTTRLHRRRQEAWPLLGMALLDAEIWSPPGRPYGTPCSHEHACIRCPMLRVDPRQRDRLIAIIRNLTDRITEAKTNGWLGEAQGLHTSLEAAKGKLANLNKAALPPGSPTDLGMPIIRDTQ